MLKAQENVTGPQSALFQKKTSKDGAKVTGNNTINLLKATTKVLAFLNPTGRKTQSYDTTEQEDRQQYQQHQSLVQNIADNRRHHYQRRGPPHEGFDDDNVEIFKHVFQNRPINNFQPQNTITYNGIVHQQSNHSKYTGMSSPAQSTQLDSTPVTYTQPADITISEADQQYAKEQLWIVRRNLRNHPPESIYFQRFAPLADDWRNFLPCSDSFSCQDGRGIGNNHSTNIEFEWVETACEHQSTRAAASSLAKWRGPQDYREDFFDARSTAEDNSNDEYPGEWASDEEQQKTQIPPLKSEVSNRVIYDIPIGKSGSSTSFVKELLREEELCRLVTVARLGVQNDTSSTRFGTKSGVGRDRENMSVRDSTDYGAFLDNDDSYASMFYQNHSRVNRDGDGSDANDADADEVAELTDSRLLRKGGNARGIRAKRTRQQRSSVTKEKFQKTTRVHKGLQSLQKNDLQKLGYSSNKSSRCHAPGIGSDILRSIESEFTLDIEDSSEDHGSEDSLSYLIADYEDEDELPSVYARAGKPFKAMETVVSTGEEGDDCPLSSPDCSSAASPTTTLLESSQDSEPVSGISSVASSKMDQPPMYVLHEQDRAVGLPTCDIHAGLSHQEIHASHKQLISLCEQEKEVMEAAEIEDKKGLKSGLTVHTMSHGHGGIAPGPLSAFVSRPLGSQHSLTKCNSTSSLYIDSTMLKSDVDETLRAVATVLYEKVLESHRKNDCRTERIVNSSSYVASDRVVMTQADIFDFMRFIFDCGQNLGAENAIITLIYVERMTDVGNLAFHAINWRRLLLGALILSIKVWEDLAVFNSDVCAIFEGLSVKDVNALERFSMAKLQYNVSVKRSVYAAYYFRLRDVSEAQHNLHYGKLTLSMSQRDMALARNNSCVSSAHGSSSGLAQHSASSSSSRSSRNGSTHGSATGGLMGMGMVGMAPKASVGPGCRKWTLKPLSVREADRLEARSSMFCSNMMMEEQERKDAGCFWDEYTAMGRASPVDLTISSSISSSIAGSSMHTISSSTSNMAAQDSAAKGGAGGAASAPASNLASETSECAGEPVRRVLKLKKSRSDFFFQNSTPASIM